MKILKKERMMKGCFIATCFFVLYSMQAMAQLRVALPEESDLSGNTLKEGELFYNETEKKVFINSENSVQTVNLIAERLPTIYSAEEDNTILGVSSGNVIIGRNLYSNTSNITCSTSTEGLGGYEGTQPSGSLNFYYLYLVPDTRSGYEGKFNCIISSSSSGPSSSPYSASWRRVASFKLDSEWQFTSRGGRVQLFSPPTIVFTIPQNTGSMTDISLSPFTFSPAIKEMKYTFSCSNDHFGAQFNFVNTTYALRMSCEFTGLPEYTTRNAFITQTSNVKAMNTSSSININVSIKILEFQEELQNSIY